MRALRIAFVKWLIIFSAMILIGGCATNGISKNDCTKNVDIALANSMLSDVSLTGKILKTIDENRINVAKMSLEKEILLEMKNIWITNQKYGGDLGQELISLITNIYPRVRADFNFDQYKTLPPSSRAELTNFIAYADNVLKYQH